MDVEVVIEIPQGSRNKYEMDHKTGRIRLDRMLFTSTARSAAARPCQPRTSLDLPGSSCL